MSWVPGDITVFLAVKLPVVQWSFNRGIPVWCLGPFCRKLNRLCLVCVKLGRCDECQAHNQRISEIIRDSLVVSSLPWWRVWMKRNGWVVMLLLVSLAGQSMAVALPNPCHLSGLASDMHTNSQDVPDCCDFSSNTACPPGGCVMGGCASACLPSLLSGTSAPAHAAQLYFRSSSHQSSPPIPLFRPPIA